MPGVEFLAGSEKRFFDYLSLLEKSGKTALLSHTDLDGLAAARIANECIKADRVEFLDYVEINSALIEKLRKENVGKIILLDLSVTTEFVKEAEKFFDVLIIDHHLFSQDFNSEKTFFLNAQGYCAAYLCYVLFSQVQSLEQYDWLVACACIADWLYLKNKNFMEKIFVKYRDHFSVNDDNRLIRQEGFFWDLQWQISLGIIFYDDHLKKAYSSLKSLESVARLKKKSTMVQKEIDELIENFEKEKIKIPAGFFFEIHPQFVIGSIVANIISTRYWNSTIVILQCDKRYGHLNLRRQDGKVNMKQLVLDYISGFEEASGGGHARAAGGHILKKDRKKLIEKIKNSQSSTTRR